MICGEASCYMVVVVAVLSLMKVAVTYIGRMVVACVAYAYEYVDVLCSDTFFHIFRMKIHVHLRASPNVQLAFPSGETAFHIYRTRMDARLYAQTCVRLGALSG